MLKLKVLPIALLGLLLTANAAYSQGDNFKSDLVLVTKAFEAIATKVGVLGKLVSVTPQAGNTGQSFWAKIDRMAGDQIPMIEAFDLKFKITHPKYDVMYTCQGLIKTSSDRVHREYKLFACGKSSSDTVLYSGEWK